MNNRMKDRQQSRIFNESTWRRDLMTATNFFVVSMHLPIRSVKGTIIKFKHSNRINRNNSKEQNKNGREYFFEKYNISPSKAFCKLGSNLARKR